MKIVNAQHKWYRNCWNIMILKRQLLNSKLKGHDSRKWQSNLFLIVPYKKYIVFETCFQSCQWQSNLFVIVPYKNCMVFECFFQLASDNPINFLRSRNTTIITLFGNMNIRNHTNHNQKKIWVFLQLFGGKCKCTASRCVQKTLQE